ncbi:MAG TPA: copper resistance protein CopC [Thermomicrobiales bacterium]|nr:copper resistance protein CopC [Thermomicrobiales bacterium]
MHPTGGGWRSRAALLIPLLVIVFGLLAILPERADAHAFLERSDPSENRVLPEAPAEVSLLFTEPLEPDFSSAELYDATGTLIPTEPSRIGEPNQLLLTLPTDLPNGTYTVQWRNVSSVDGHPQQGFVPFTIGSQADVVTPSPPQATNFSEPPTWLSATGRWLSLLGLTGAAGAVICWLWVIRVARDPLDDDDYDRVQDRISTLIMASVGVGILGSLIALVVQAQDTGEGVSIGTILDILIDTRYGHLWAARVILLLGLAAVAASDALWEEPPATSTIILTLGLAAGAMLPYSLNSHAAAQPIGADAAVAADWLHLAASSVWIGGLLAMLVTLILGTRGAPREQRRQVFAAAVPRFTTLALISVIILSLTGFYSAWLQVGNLIALRDTSYGQTLIVKLLLLVPLLTLGALNMRVIGPRLLSSARSGIHFGRTVAAEVVLGVAILLVVGLLTSLPTARDTITEDAENTIFRFIENDVYAVLYITPGSAGFNRYTADITIDGLESPSDVQLLLRLEKAGDVEGIREVPLEYRFGNRFESQGLDLSVTGDWNLEFIVRREGEADARFQEEINIPQTPPADRVPGQPPRFVGTTSAAAVLFSGLAIVAIVGSLRAPGVWQDRIIGTGIGSALLLAGGLIMLVNLDDPTPTALTANPIPLTEESIVAGQLVYAENCATCHGQEGRGDGPASVNLEPPPANLTEPHVAVHTDGDLHWWITNGIQPAMPAFGEDLTQDEIWNVINYVRSLSEPASASGQ